MTLTDQQKDVLKLVNRSRTDEDGWVTCASPAVFTQLIKPMPPELVETRPGTRQCRLTDEALAVIKWL